MFPYPSGRLHLGHMRVYTISDVTARFYRLNGYRVIHPIGWDSFGLPAENAARERGVDPREWTVKNIETMRHQLLKTGVLFDWEREISTCSPDFFKWTQWLFCKLHEHGMLKRIVAEVNWDPVDQTVLAAEQIDSEGRSWRSGAKAEKRKLKQWMIETPKYAKRLSDGLNALSAQWGEVADIQQNWIGPCDVYRFIFPVRNTTSGKVLEETLDLRIHEPTRIADASFIVLKPGHPLAEKDKKTPYRLPLEILNGVTGQWIPVVVADDEHKCYLDARVGDADDVALVKQFDIAPRRPLDTLNKNDVLEMAAFGGYGGYLTSRSLQDWVVSRQRRWGTPIPMIIGKNPGPVPPEQLPVLNGSQLQDVDQDTLDTFFDSSWYWLRYLDPNSDRIVSEEALADLPVDVYVGGIEHAAVHMFFARFMAYFMNDLGIIPIKEPFTDVIPQGVVRGRTMVEKSTGRYLKADDVTENDGKWTLKNGQERGNGEEEEEVEVSFVKMSKSKSNGVDPEDVLQRDGIDMSRLQLLDAAAPRAPINWGESDLKGLRKWLDRMGGLVYEVSKAQKTAKVDAKKRAEMKENYNFFVRNVTMCLEVLHLHNTALARLKGYTNALKKFNPEDLASCEEGRRCVRALVLMLQVFAPHTAAELWEQLGELEQQSWPKIDEDAPIDFMIYVNQVSCGRWSVDRRELEHLSLEQAMERAKQKEHADFMALFNKSGLVTKNTVLDTKPGLYVSIQMSLEGCKEANGKVISKMLDTVQAQRRKASKKVRKA